nr:immunoglobulin light chain junction region [Macaca mulatta]
CQQGDSNPRTF